MTSYKDIAVEQSGHVATIEIRRPPHNFFDFALMREVAEAMEAADRDPDCRAIVLASAGKSFCAGMLFEPASEGSAASTEARLASIRQLYAEGARLFRIRKPIVVAVHGPAIGGGLGLAMVGDFRVTCAEARFSANFTRIGLHPGFGLTVTLPRLIGTGMAELLLYTGRRIDGVEAVRIGLANQIVPLAEVRAAARALAAELAECGPLALQATRSLMRRTLADDVVAATAREFEQQARLYVTADFREGIKASAERRKPEFRGV